MNEQDKVVFKNIIGAFTIKGLSLVISFISMPLYIKYFNNDIYLGLWFTILSILTWVLTFDFGIGNGLRNHLVKPLEERNKEEAKVLISSSYIIIGKLSLIISFVIVSLIYILNWNKILNISTTQITESKIRTVLLINMATIVLQLFLRTISSILYALQKSAVNNLMTLISTAIQLIFIFIYKTEDPVQNLIILSVVHMFSVISPLLLATLIVFMKPLKGLFPSYKLYNKEKAKLVFQDGAKIFVNQIFYLILTGINAFLITNLLGNEYVVDYQKYYRIFMLIGMLYMLALTPMWSAVTQAKVRKDYLWIRKYFKLLVLGSILVLAAQLFILPFLQFGFDIWLGKGAENANYLSAILFAIYGFIFTLQSALSTFAMGLNKTGLQTIMYFIGVVIKLLLTLLFVKIVGEWHLIVLIDIIAFLPYCIFEYQSVSKLINQNIKLSEVQS